HQNLAFSVVSIIKLRKQFSLARQILDLLQTFVLKVRQISIVCRLAVGIRELAHPGGKIYISVGKSAQFIRGRTRATETVKSPVCRVRRAINGTANHSSDLVVAKSNCVVGERAVDID